MCIIVFKSEFLIFTVSCCPALSNDHKELTREMEILLHRLHAISRGRSSNDGDERIESSSGGSAEVRVADPLAVPAFSSAPFAEIDEISPNSPAWEGGLRLGDCMIRFGHVTLQTPNYLTAVASALAAAKDKEIEAIILRNGERKILKLKPHQWEGSGLLGCHLRPLK